MTPERMRLFSAQLRPLNWAGFAVTLGLIAALALGPKGIANPYVLLCLVLSALINTARNVKLYGLMDEYEKSLMLRAVAVAFIFLMASVFIVGAAATFSPPEAVSPLLLVGLFLASWAVFGVTHHLLQRREASS